jgi:hypothetical protein
MGDADMAAAVVVEAVAKAMTDDDVVVDVVVVAMDVTGLIIRDGNNASSIASTVPVVDDVLASYPQKYAKIASKEIWRRPTTFYGNASHELDECIQVTTRRFHSLYWRIKSLDSGDLILRVLESRPPIPDLELFLDSVAPAVIVDCRYDRNNNFEQTFTKEISY